MLHFVVRPCYNTFPSQVYYAPRTLHTLIAAPVLPADISVTASPASVLLWHPEVNQHCSLVVAGVEGLGVSPDAMGLLSWLEKNPINVSSLQAFHQGIDSAPIPQLSKQFFKKCTFEVPDPEGKCILGSKIEGRGQPCARCRCVILLQATFSCCRLCTLVPIMHPYMLLSGPENQKKPTVISAFPLPAFLAHRGGSCNPNRHQRAACAACRAIQCPDACWCTPHWEVCWLLAQLAVCTAKGGQATQHRD